MALDIEMSVEGFDAGGGASAVLFVVATNAVQSVHEVISVGEGDGRHKREIDVIDLDILIGGIRRDDVLLDFDKSEKGAQIIKIFVDRRRRTTFHCLKIKQKVFDQIRGFNNKIAFTHIGHTN